VEIQGCFPPIAWLSIQSVRTVGRRCRVYPSARQVVFTPDHTHRGAVVDGARFALDQNGGRELVTADQTAFADHRDACRRGRPKACASIAYVTVWIRPVGVGQDASK